MTLLFVFSILAPLLLMFFVFYKAFPIVSESTQEFTDIIIENVSSSGLNKSGELSLFWCSAGVCILLTALLLFFLCRHKEITQKKRAYSESVMAALTVCAFILTEQLVVYKTVSVICLIAVSAIVLTLFFYRKTPGDYMSVLVTCMLSYYLVVSALTVLTYFSPRFAVSQYRIYLFAAGMSLILLIISHYLHFSCKKILLLLQTGIPFLLFLFFRDTYLYHGELIRVPYSGFYYVFFGFLLTIGLLLLILHAKKNWHNASALSLSGLIHPFTAISIFIYNSYSACPMYAQPDQHHHGEQMIPWQQIVTLGQTAYEEYTPVSGLFPLFNGFIQNVLLGGTVSDYSPAISIMVVLFCIVTMYLIYRHVGVGCALVFAIFFALPAYNRQYMVLPVLLLLFLKELLDRPGRWLKTWLLTCFLAGLYYPLFGAATLVGTTPLGIYMFLQYKRKTDWKSELKKPAFYLSWFLCLLPVFLCIPLLLRMAEHTLIYSGQTVLSEGISLYGQIPPEVFMPYLTAKHEFLRTWLYYGLRFFLPIVPLMLATGLLVFAHVTNKSKKGASKTWFLLSMTAVVLSLTVSYTYTLVRADHGAILSRTAPVLVAVAGIFLPVMVIRYGKKWLASSLRIGIISICMALPMLLYHQVSAMKFPDMWIYPNGSAGLLMDDSDKLFTYYEVPETFISMKEIPLSDTSALGNGFMVADQVHYLESYDALMQKCNAVDPSLCYLGLDGQGFYYYLNARCCGTGFIQTAKGYDAQQRLLEKIKAERPVIVTINPLQSYYIFYWMLTNDYIYSDTDKAFLPGELYQKLYPATKQVDDYREFCTKTELWTSPGSFGESASSLLPLLSSREALPISAQTPLTIKGQDYDVLLLELNEDLVSPSTFIELTFLSDNRKYQGSCIQFLRNNEVLLVPLGMNANWLLGDNSEIKLNFYDEAGESLAEIPIELAPQIGIDGCFLKLRQ